MKLEPTAVRVWKRLTREERLAAAAWFWREPPEALVPQALAAIVKARHMRPQAARTLSEDARVQTLAGLLEPGEALASALLVSLHLGERRGVLTCFLDAVGLPHEEGLLKDETDTQPLAGEAARRGVAALAAAFPPEQVIAYVNTLWLQDPERWGALEDAPSWLAAPGS